jgi:xanthine dehydrogenase iron-sulfur cluster and FAD-binding subunit A
LKTFRTAGQLARCEITPISDVRGTASYRSQLAENLLLKFFHEQAGTDPKHDEKPEPHNGRPLGGAAGGNHHA